MPVSNGMISAGVPSECPQIFLPNDKKPPYSKCMAAVALLVSSYSAFIV